MSSEGDRIELRRPNVCFTFGRFNPPTVGHKAMIQNLIGMADAAGADAYVFPSKTQDAEKNPLLAGEKVHILKSMFPDPSVVRIIHPEVRGTSNIPAVLRSLRDAGYESITMVVGSDRVPDFAGKFGGVDVVSGGIRDMDSDELAGLETVSASKVRAAALAGNTNTFRKAMNNSLNTSAKNALMGLIKTRMSVAPTTGRKKKGGSRRVKKRMTRRR
jgi:hypothetical protein